MGTQSWKIYQRGSKTLLHRIATKKTFPMTRYSSSSSSFSSQLSLSSTSFSGKITGSGPKKSRARSVTAMMARTWLRPFPLRLVTIWCNFFPPKATIVNGFLLQSQLWFFLSAEKIGKKSQFIYPKYHIFTNIQILTYGDGNPTFSTSSYFVILNNIICLDIFCGQIFYQTLANNIPK